jgi:hypothetical protein
MVAEYKSTYTNNEQTEKEYTETIPFTIASKKLNTKE